PADCAIGQQNAEFRFRLLFAARRRAQHLIELGLILGIDNLAGMREVPGRNAARLETVDLADIARASQLTSFQIELPPPGFGGGMRQLEALLGGDERLSRRAFVGDVAIALEGANEV